MLLCFTHLLKDLGAFNVFFPSKIWNETGWTELPYTSFSPPFLFMAFWSQSSEDLLLAGDLGAVLVLLSW